MNGKLREWKNPRGRWLVHSLFISQRIEMHDLQICKCHRQNVGKLIDQSFLPFFFTFLLFPLMYSILEYSSIQWLSLSWFVHVIKTHLKPFNNWLNNWLKNSFLGNAHIYIFYNFKEPHNSLGRFYQYLVHMLSSL